MNISVIVPVFNVEKYIHQCIYSILNQTYRNFELILVDDGSTDNSGSICDAFALSDSRIKVLHKANGGVGAARNCALEQCSGDYICFIDSDDYIQPDFLEVLYNHINGSTYDFVSCIANFVDENGVFIKNNQYNNHKFEISSNELFHYYFHTNLIEDACWNKIYKKELFNDIKFTQGIIFEDSEIIVRILKKCNKILFTSLPLYNYRIRKNSILNYDTNDLKIKKFSLKKLDLLKVYEMNYFELIQTDYRNIFLRKIIFCAIEFYNSSRILDVDDFNICKSVIKSYYNKYKKFILHKGIFTLKERIYIYTSMSFGKIFFTIYDLYKNYIK